MDKISRLKGGIGLGSFMKMEQIYSIVKISVKSMKITPYLHIIRSADVIQLTRLPLLISSIPVLEYAQLILP